MTGDESRCSVTGDRLGRLGCFAGALLVLVGSLVAPAGASDWFDDTETQAAEIRRVYQKLAELTAAEPQPLAFELEDFQTLRHVDLGRATMREALTLPGGEMVDVARLLVREGLDGRIVETSVRYRPSWTGEEPSWEEGEEGRQSQGRTLRQMVAGMESVHPGFRARDVRAVTSYEVEVALGDGARRYRAAFLWLTGETAKLGFPSNGGPSFLVLDHITGGVAAAAVETLRPSRLTSSAATLAALEGPRPAPADLGLATSSEPAICVESYTTHTVSPPAQVGTANHGPDLFGGPSSHKARAEFSFTCSCSRDCVSRCEAGMPVQKCRDEGPLRINGCHKTGTGPALQSNTLTPPMSLSSNVLCGGAFSCNVRECPDCTCMVETRVTLSLEATVPEAGSVGIENHVSFVNDPSHLWAANIAEGFGCPPCAAGPPPPPPGCTCQPPLKCAPNGTCVQACGDGQVQPWETCASCPQDVGCPAGTRCDVTARCEPCPPACETLSATCGWVQFCGQYQFCGNCTSPPGNPNQTGSCVNNRCEYGGPCDPCSDLAPNLCGFTWSTSCSGWRTCECGSPYQECRNGNCVNRPSDGGGGDSGDGGEEPHPCDYDADGEVTYEECNDFYCIGTGGYYFDDQCSALAQ